MLRTAIAIVLSFTMLSQSALADGEEAAPRFKDVRVGEGTELSRVAIICAGPCDVERDADGSFYLSGVSGSLDIDLSARNGFISALRIEDLVSGAFLRVDTVKASSEITLAACGATVICVDFKKPALINPSVSATRVVPVRQPKVAPTPAPDSEGPPSDKVRAPIKVSRVNAEAKQLPVPDDWSAEIAEKLQDISPLPLAHSDCPAYRQALQKDAWNLDAFKMVAFCAAAVGKLARAEALLERYLKLYPDDQSAKDALARLAAVQRQPATQPKVALRGRL